MLLRRYNDINYIMSMDIDYALEFVIKAFEKEEDETIFRMYLHDPFTQLSFDDYKAQIQKKPYVKMDEKTIIDIVSDAEKIMMKRGD